MDCRSEGSLAVDDYARRWANKDIRNQCQCMSFWANITGRLLSAERRCDIGQLITFDMLPDDVLVEIFYFYADEDMDMDTYFGPYEKPRIEEWTSLAHVCRRWRSIVFQSPRCLNLRLLCTSETPVRDTLDIWPPLPLVVHDWYGIRNPWCGRSGVDNFIAALEHNDRVCEIRFDRLLRSEFEYVLYSDAMDKPFPELTCLRLIKPSTATYTTDPTLPDSFLGGFAPRLRSLHLHVPFLGVQKLLLSATRLVYLSLFFIPRSAGYVPPEAMATSLSALTNLEFLRLEFRLCPHPALESRSPPPPPLTRSILPSLTKIQFEGTTEYLEEISARIDAPRVNKMDITFNPIIFDTPQLSEFISRRPTLRAPRKGHIAFNYEAIFVKFPSQTSNYDILSVQFPYMGLGPRPSLASLEQICTSSFPPLSTLEDLYISEELDQHCWLELVENATWLDLLRSFVTVKNLYISQDLVPLVASDLQQLVGGRTTEVLPALENIFLEGFRPSRPMEKFVAARGLTGHPVAVSRWDRNLNPIRLVNQ